MKYFFEIENWQKCCACISLRKQCFHHIHVPYAPGYMPSPIDSLVITLTLKDKYRFNQARLLFYRL
jgi:hypothetical protein